jgi:hypothetical protein
VDPVNGNFTPTTWVEGDVSWVNNAVGANFVGVWANTDFDIWFVGYAGPSTGGLGSPPIAAHFDGFSLQPIQIAGTEGLNAVWGRASDDVWAVGSYGLIVHWDGTGWVAVPSGTRENLYAVSGTASDDVWAGGPTVMLHWDGTSWAPSPSFVPSHWGLDGAGLAAISRDDALVAISNGCQRWDGTSWHSTPCGVLGGRAVFATSSEDIWVVGNPDPVICSDAGYRAHWDGLSWSTVARGGCWATIAGTGPTDIWIDGTLHYDGTTWTEMTCGPRFNAMSASNNGAIMGVNGFGIEYFSGDDGWPFLARTSVGWRALGGRDPANIWAAGGDGTVIRYDGSRWSGQDFPLPRNDDYLYPIFGSSPSDIWGVSRNGFLHFDGRSWTAVSGPRRSFRTGFARAPNDAIAVDDQGGKWHWDGTSWWEITLPIFGSDSIYELWGTAPDDVWAVGCCSGGIHHWDGDSWERVYTASEPFVDHVGGSARDDVWFTLRGQEFGTNLVHFDGQRFTQVFVPIGDARGITSTNPNDVWLRSFRLYHYDGVSWTEEPVTALNAMLGVRGAGAFFTSHLGAIYQSR